jgi:hypothetical protein
MDAHAAAAGDVTREDEAAPPATTIAALPHALLARVLARVPVDTRLRCAEVSAGWCAFLASERSLWTALDFSPSSGVTRLVTDALLHAAVAKAGGALTSLDVSFRVGERISDEELLAVVTANAGSLLELRAHGDPGNDSMSCEEVERLLRAAPRLQRLVADVHCDAGDAVRVLRNEGVFQPLRIWKLALETLAYDGVTVHALAAALAVHTTPLGCFTLYGTALDAPDVLDALVDAALANRLGSFKFKFGRLFPASVPSLVRLLGSGGALTGLSIHDGPSRQLLDAPAAALLGGALRTHSTFEKLVLTGMNLWHDVAAATILMTSLVAHPSLRKLNVSMNRAAAPGHAACVGALLFALVAANAPALQTLRVSSCQLGDDGLRPLFEALPRNTHLRELRCHDDGMSEAFARDALLPAVRANSSLTKLSAAPFSTNPSGSAFDAERIVTQRAAAR